MTHAVEGSRLPVTGSGGGGGKGGGGSTRAPREGPNTLRSKAYARVIDVLSEGEIEGLVDGPKSVYFNETALQNVDDSFNFESVSYGLMAGLPDQTWLPGFAEVESEVIVGVEVTNATPVIRSVSEPDLDALRVTLRLPALTFQDTSTGDLKATKVQIAIDVQENGGSYIEVVNDLIEGKTVSPYERDYRLALPAGGAPWNVRVRRITADTEEVNIQDTVLWARYTEIIDNRMIYPDTALIGLEVDAEPFGSQVPRRAYEIKGIKIQLPSNYNPTTRVYSGIWDGTFQTAWSDNPAWVLYDLITNDRYGIGEFVDAAMVDKWTLYDIAQYCDELVPDGFGGSEPRFTFNFAVTTQEEAYKALQSVASVFRGMIYWGAGVVTATQDSPADPVKLVTPANVEGGLFNYEGVSLKGRKTAAFVTWYDPSDFSRPAIEVVEDPDLIDRFGWRPVDVTAMGCASRGQAHRVGRWLLEGPPESVTYTAGYDHYDLRPGDVVAIADPAYADVRYGGRTVSATTTQVTIDAAVTLSAGDSYTLSVVLPDNAIEEKTVTNGAGSHSVLTLDSALSDTPEIGAMWVITSNTVAPRQFRVLAVRETEEHQFAITAVLHDPTKYARIEQNLQIEPSSYTALPSGPLVPPTNLAFRESLYQAGAAIRNKITLSWTFSSDTRVQLYEVQIKTPGTTAWAPAGSAAGNTLEIFDTETGGHSFRVRGLDGIGRPSAWLALNDQTMLGIAAPPDDVEGFSVSIIGDNAFLTWNPNADLDLSHYTVRFSPVLAGATWGSATELVKQVAKPATSVSAPALVGSYLIKAVDGSGSESVNAALIVSSIAGITFLNAVANEVEQPDFDGTHNNTAATGSQLRLASQDALDDWPSLDAVVTLAYGINGYVSSGTYSFTSPDLGQVYTSRLTPKLEVSGANDNNVLASWSSLSEVENLSGTDPSQWGALLEVRTTDDDPSGTPSWSAWEPIAISDYAARAFEFRLTLSSSAVNVTPAVSILEVEIDMPDRVDGRQGVTSPAAGLRVTYSPAFRATPAVAISGLAMNTGDYFAITNENATGFDVRFFNASATGVQRDFNWIARGYGYQQAA
jgi:predicted phage tail protein